MAQDQMPAVRPLASSTSPVHVIDSQLHCWVSLDRRHWSEHDRRTHLEPFPVEDALVAMTAARVTAALVHVLCKGHDRTAADAYSHDISRRFPDTIATVAVIDPMLPDIDEAMAEGKQSGARALRLFFRDDTDEAAWDHGLFTPVFVAARHHAMPTKIFAPGRMDLVARIAAAHPDVILILDHLGIPQPPRHRRDSPPLQRLPELLKLANFPNLAIKITGMPSLSERAFPFPDLAPGLDRLLEAFGGERLIWGSDMTRFRGLFTYAELVDYMFTMPFSIDERTAVMGGNLARLLDWPAAMAPRTGRLPIGLN